MNNSNQLIWMVYYNDIIDTYNKIQNSHSATKHTDRITNSKEDGSILDMVNQIVNKTLIR